MIRRLGSRIKKFSVGAFNFIAAFLRQASEQGSRSTILGPLAWLLAIMVAGLLGAIRYKADTWIIILFAIFCTVAVVMYLGTFAYCLLTGREALLRSEKYSIQKLAIETFGPLGQRGKELTPEQLSKLSLVEPSQTEEQ